MQQRDYMRTVTTTIKHDGSAGRGVRARIEQSLHTRTAPPGTSRATVEGIVKRSGARVWHALRKRPSVGIVVVGTAGLALATVTGVGELTIGLVAAYAAYQVLSEGLSPEQAAENVVEEIEHAP